MASQPRNRTFSDYPGLKMAIVSSGFALLLSAAVLSGSYVVQQTAHQPSFEKQLRQMHGVSTSDLVMPGYEGVSASVLASQASEQRRELMEMQGTRMTVGTHHHERGAI